MNHESEAYVGELKKLREENAYHRLYMNKLKFALYELKASPDPENFIVDITLCDLDKDYDVILRMKLLPIPRFGSPWRK